MTTPRAALIDLDGTLVDSAPELAWAIDRMLADREWPAAGPTKVRGWLGEGLDALIARALADALGREADAAEHRAARVRFDTAYAEVLGTRSAPYPGVLAGLDRLRGAGLATACITNKARLFALPLLGALDLAGRFDLLVAGDSGPPKKPDPAPLAFAAERLGVALADCVMVGDSAIDVAAARAAGCPVACVRSGYGPAESLDPLGAGAVFDRFDRLTEALVAGHGPD